MEKVAVHAGAHVVNESGGWSCVAHVLEVRRGTRHGAMLVLQRCPEDPALREAHVTVPLTECPVYEEPAGLCWELGEDVEIHCLWRLRKGGEASTPTEESEDLSDGEN